MKDVFTGSFTQQEPIPEEGIEAANRVMRHGRLHRYNTVEGEISETALLEQEFAAAIGARYALAVSSGGYAMQTALRATGVVPGDAVLSNAFTLAPVPGAIASVGAQPVFVEVTQSLTIDLDDLERKAGESGAKVLLLSHMRGHICDMERILQICARHDLILIEDCAHTMGASWRGTPSGRFGAVGCFSTQTYKHANSGEGGFLATDDQTLAAKSILLSGSYMLYDRHLASPEQSVFEDLRLDTPNISGRMDNLRAAILRPQIHTLDEKRTRWAALYTTLEAGLRNTRGLAVIPRPSEESFMGSSIQFLLLDWSDGDIEAVVNGCKSRGVELKWFGAPEPQGFTSTYRHWRFADPKPMPASDRILHGTIDMRLPLTFSVDDAAQISRIISEEVSAIAMEEVSAIAMEEVSASAMAASEGQR